eukprot:GFYU01005133.1.p1 GENE.GFYU01005133.1~~GFYU01005133.1.p1  ORF type:complete len:1146 (-),score=237.64 GFYU01005133.1:88-3525(-)
MKYGKKLRAEAIPEFKHAYMPYKELKQLLRQIVNARLHGAEAMAPDLQANSSRGVAFLTGGDAGSKLIQDLESKFLKIIDESLVSINEFVDERTDQLHNSITSSLPSIRKKTENAQRWTACVLNLVRDITNMDKFIQQNYIGFQKIIKKYDKKTGAQSSTWLGTKLKGEKFLLAQSDLADMVLEVSELFNALEAFNADEVRESEMWNAPVPEIRDPVKEKYLIPTSDILHVKMELARNGCLKIFGRDHSALFPDARFPLTMNDQADDFITQNMCTSVYYDTKKLQCYNDRVAGKPNTKTFRLRFYGDGFIHKETDMLALQSKVSAAMEGTEKAWQKPNMVLTRQKQLNKFFAGEDFNVTSASVDTDEPSQKELDMCLPLQEHVVKNLLEPILSVRYRCLPFWKMGVPAIATLDEEIEFVDQAHAEVGLFKKILPKDPERLDSSLRKTMRYCVLEIVRDASCDLQWVTNIANSAGVVKIPAFSKYIHGVSLFETLTEENHLSPAPWGRKLLSTTPQDDVRSQGKITPKYESEMDRGEQGNKKGNVFQRMKSLSRRGIRKSPESLEDKPDKPVKSRGKIEPKTFFANERTLLQWLSTAVMIMVAALALTNFNSEAAKLAGLALAPAPLFLMIYALRNFWKRSKALEEKRNVGYNDRFGATVVVLFLLLVLALSFAFTLRDLYQTHIASKDSTKAEPNKWEYSFYCPVVPGGEVPEINTRIKFEPDQSTYSSYIRRQKVFKLNDYAVGASTPYSKDTKIPMEVSITLQTEATATSIMTLVLRRAVNSAAELATVLNRVYITQDATRTFADTIWDSPDVVTRIVEQRVAEKDGTTVIKQQDIELMTSTVAFTKWRGVTVASERKDLARRYIETFKGHNCLEASYHKWLTALFIVPDLNAGLGTSTGADAIVAPPAMIIPSNTTLDYPVESSDESDPLLVFYIVGSLCFIILCAILWKVWGCVKPRLNRLVADDHSDTSSMIKRKRRQSPGVTPTGPYLMDEATSGDRSPQMVKIRKKGLGGAGLKESESPPTESETGWTNSRRGSKSASRRASVFESLAESMVGSRRSSYISLAAEEGRIEHDTDSDSDDIAHHPTHGSTPVGGRDTRRDSWFSSVISRRSSIAPSLPTVDDSPRFDGELKEVHLQIPK